MKYFNVIAASFPPRYEVSPTASFSITAWLCSYQYISVWERKGINWARRGHGLALGNNGYAASLWLSDKQLIRDTRKRKEEVKQKPNKCADTECNTEHVNPTVGAILQYISLRIWWIHFWRLGMKYITREQGAF